jgi:glutamate-5-semialdehyde dehydrogenase
MSTASTQPDLHASCLDMAQRARQASIDLELLSGAEKNRWLAACARLLRERSAEIEAANAQDLAAAPDFGLTPAQIDRLRLTAAGIEKLAKSVDEVRSLVDPVGEVIESTRRPNGLEVQKIRVPLGVVFFIYESRPNVTVDAAVLCVKSGNAVILRGGKEAFHSNQALAGILRSAALETGLPGDAVQLVGTTDRAAVGEFLRMPEYISVTIPRGGESLIRRVAAEAQMPVIKHFDGNCHVYIDAAADPELAVRLTVNSKCQRMGVCNAAESLLVHEAVAETLLPRIAAALIAEGVEIRGDEATCRLVPQAISATEDDYKAEFLGPIISVAVVPSLDAAASHIRKYGSAHTDAIITRDLAAARRFTRVVDSAAVVVNASTRFNDGGELGLGAEIGISTDKFHARGPCGLRELTSYKWIVYGEGQIRE